LILKKLLNPIPLSESSKELDINNTEPIPLTDSLVNNLSRLTSITGEPSDLVIHYLTESDKPDGAIIFLKSLVDEPLLGLHVAEPLNSYLRREDKQGLDVPLTKSLLYTADITEITDIQTAVQLLMAGKTLIFMSNMNVALAVLLPGYPRRPIEDSPSEKVLKGSREGFTESIQDNLSMIRRWIKDPNLCVEAKIIGTRTRTELAILYLKDVANQSIVQEVHKRLDKIRIDGIIDSGYISELIADNKTTYFPLTQETERPDKVAAAILEGRVAILVDKSSFNIIVPVTSTEFYQNREDFSFNYWVGTFLRIIRAIGTLISVTLPGLYLATASINPELLPPLLVQLLASSRVQVPFPLAVEFLVAMIIFEIFREAILRIPGNISSILGIAGGLLLGEAALSISIVSPASIVVVVITTLATFTTADPAKEQAWRITRYFLIFAAASFGIYGLSLAGFVVLTHMANLKSFGISYLMPWSPPIAIDMIDAYFRLPLWASFRRPPTYRPQDENRLEIKKEEDD